MADVIVYTKKPCPYCESAKRLLRDKGVDFKEVLLSKPEEMAELKRKTGWMTFPQVFINGKMIGGFDDMSQLDHSGQLDKLLGL